MLRANESDLVYHLRVMVHTSNLTKIAYMALKHLRFGWFGAVVCSGTCKKTLVAERIG